MKQERERLYLMGHGQVKSEIISIPKNVTVVFYVEENWSIAVNDFTFWFAENETNKEKKLAERLSLISKKTNISTSSQPFKWDLDHKQTFLPKSFGPGTKIHDHLLSPLSSDNIKTANLDSFKISPSTLVCQSGNILLSDVLNSITHSNPKHPIELHWLACRENMYLNMLGTAGLYRAQIWNKLDSILTPIIASKPILAFTAHQKNKSKIIDYINSKMKIIENVRGLAISQIIFDKNLDAVLKSMQELRDSSLLKEPMYNKLKEWCAEQIQAIHNLQNPSEEKSSYPHHKVLEAELPTPKLCMS